MAIEIKAPTFPESVADGTVATWHKKPGEACLLYTSHHCRVNGLEVWLSHAILLRILRRRLRIAACRASTARPANRK